MREGNPSNQTQPNHEIFVDDATGPRRKYNYSNTAALTKRRRVFFVDKFVLFYLQLCWFDPSQAGEMRRGRGGGFVSFSEGRETKDRVASFSFAPSASPFPSFLLPLPPPALLPRLGSILVLTSSLQRRGRGQGSSASSEEEETPSLRKRRRRSVRRSSPSHCRHRRSPRYPPPSPPAPPGSCRLQRREICDLS